MSDSSEHDWLTSSPRPLRWLFLDLNSYFASAEQQAEPRLRGRPVVVAPVMTNSTCAIAASREAKAFGIKTGTPIWEARRLCHDLVIVPARHELYTRYHAAIFAEVERHLPVTTIMSIDEGVCRLLDNENQPDTARAIARRIKAGIAAHVGACLTSSIGIAPTRLLAKMASDMEKPDGLVVIEAHELPERLHALDLSDIPGVGPRMKRRLTCANIHSMEQLLALGPQGMARVWGGTPGARMWWALMGKDFADKASTERTIGHSHVLAPADRAMAPARQVCRRLLLKAAARLRAKDRAARELTLTLRLEEGGRWGAQARLEATHDSFRLLAALDQLWTMAEHARIRHPRACGVTLSGLVMAEPAQAQLALFDAPPVRRDQDALWQGIDKLNRRFGRNKVTIGGTAGRNADRTGAVIAFSRTPGTDDFSG